MQLVLEDVKQLIDRLNFLIYEDLTYLCIYENISKKKVNL